MKRLTLQTLLRQLATATRQGVPAHDVAAVLGTDDTLSRIDRDGLAAFARALSEGAAIPEALRTSTRWLSPGAIDLLATLDVQGDAGRTARALELMAGDLLRQEDDRRAVAQAWRWPLVLLAVLCVVTLVATNYVLPAMDDMFASFGLALPTPAVVVMAVGDALPWVLLVALPVAAWLLWAARRDRTPKWIGPALARLLALMPARQRQARAAFTARMVDWYAADALPGAVESALWRHAAESAPLADLAHASGRVAQALADGRSLDAATDGVHGLPVRLRLLARLAARSPRPEGVWQAARDEVDRLADDASAALQRAISFGLYLVTAMLVAYVVMAIYLPIFKMGTLS